MVVRNEAGAMPPVDLEKLTCIALQSRDLSNRTSAEILDMYLRIYNEMRIVLEKKQQSGNWYAPVR